MNVLGQNMEKVLFDSKLNGKRLGLTSSSKNYKFTAKEKKPRNQNENIPLAFNNYNINNLNKV